jgi:hypothetical protein
MKDLLHPVQSQIKNSSTIVKELKHKKLLYNTFLFWAGATSRHTNIDTSTDITAIKNLIDTN